MMVTLMTFMFLAMIFIHVMVDFKQGIIADLKCKSWWEKNYPDKMYKDDYIMALTMHAASWAFSIYIPPFIVAYMIDYDLELHPYIIIASYIVNTIVHLVVDDLKANELKINLATDQYIHLVQIVLTAVMFIILFSI